ncbi:hypothetical protein Vadar_011363 [Vaccinium darrowii]|uniref:Uncharacterized protein n=1 Tax=Vaccinium darrowii TaxID=229202 RepID=A0ACB7Z301_9ERIC|nr:hypothetical protein Vadar_011363 [Vaccinium darrowii]
MEVTPEEESVREGAAKFAESQPLGTAAQGGDKDYTDPPASALLERGELCSWSFYRAGIAEFMASFMLVYIIILTGMGYHRSPTKCASVGIQGLSWASGGMVFILIYCTAGISGAISNLFEQHSLVAYTPRLQQQN